MIVGVKTVFFSFFLFFIFYFILFIYLFCDEVGE